MKRETTPSTRAIHGGPPGERRNQPVVPPVHLSSTFEAKDIDEQVELEERKADTFYTRYGNPTLSLAETVVAGLEGTESAAVFGSGMAAITTALLAHLKAGDHAVFQREIYGGVHRFANEILPGYGVSVGWFEADRLDGIEGVLRDNTRVLYLESPTNPTLKLVDMERVSRFARDRGIPTFIDSTFASPFNTRPQELGIDGVLHSATKYLGGHSDLLAGALAGSRALVDRVKSHLRVLGGILDPHAAYLLLRGMKTLELRVKRHNENALEVARFLEGHSRVRAVHYPMLASHPQHELARRQMKGGGGVLSFEVAGGLEEAKRFANALELVRVAPSLGSVESLLSIPCLTSHAMLSPEERRRAGIADGLVRLALGVESPEDLIQDLSHALEAV
ncbi:MAG TPA: aminotransferase class I/II-fold pyridoxal phosphate-dependent enzyme [Vicinamibacteria bacterium]|nr:aminotransferase class I/II-fold pyridoxal phosphate-dependent enzyme [Vicinamibacteria bacterium]